MLAGRNVSISVAGVSDEDAALLNGSSEERRDTLNRLLFAGPTAHYHSMREQYGDLSILDTSDYLYGLETGAEHAIDLSRGVRLYVGLEAIGEADDKGMRTVMVRVNGQLRPVFAKDESVAVTVVTAEKADKNLPGQVAAPFSGTVTQKLALGDTVEAGQPVATIEAMKMEAAITAPVNGRVARLAFEGARGVESGDLVLVIEETPAA